MAEMVLYVVEAFGVSAESLDKDYVRALINYPIAVLILLPLSLMRDMSSLAFAGVMSLASITYTMIVLVVEAPFYYPEYKAKPLAQPEPFILDWNIFQSCALVFFAYTC